MDNATDSRVFGTFGIYRYLLALMVVATHCVDRWEYAGEYAVFTFYILSGYVTSFIWHHTYQRLPHGARNYAINRLLRIFPMYFAVLAPLLCLLARYPAQAHLIHPSMAYPKDVWQWLVDLTTFGSVNPLSGSEMQPAAIPPCWTLSVEMIFWSLMPLLAKSRRARRVMLCGICLYGVICIAIAPLGPRGLMNFRYFSYFAAMLPFYAGMMIFRRKLVHRFAVPAAAFIAAAAAFALLLVVTPAVFPVAFSTGFYLSMFLGMIIIAYLSQVDTRALPAWLRWLDRVCGHIAYPVYLVHVGMELLLHMLFPSLRVFSDGFFWATVAVSTVVAWGFYCAIDVPVDRLKERFKKAGAEQAQLMVTTPI